VDNNQQAFFELVRAGLWEKEARLSQFDDIDCSVILQMAEEQSVVGLVAAGLGKVTDVKVPKEMALQFAGSTLLIEQKNIVMNNFVARLINKLRKKDVYALLVKGQGIAQCYEKPLWRACGDVDLLLNTDNYNEAKDVLIPLASAVEEEDTKRKHLGLVIENFVVELHGTLHTRQLLKVNSVVDEAQRSTFYDGKVRSWVNGGTQVLLPAPDEDVIFVFSHIIQHFFGGGIGLRQVCDWCRLLWTYRNVLNKDLLEKRIDKMGMMTEWKAFAAMAVDWLGMPVEAMPLYDSSGSWKRKANKIVDFILETGNFGHNRDQSFRKKSAIASKMGSLMRYTEDTFRHLSLFPKDALMVWWRMVTRGLNGE
jgi:hypothetical protein